VFGTVRTWVIGDRGRFSARIGLGMLVCAVSWLVASTSLSAPDRTGAYRGGVPGVHGDRFLLEVRDHDRKPTGMFKAKRFEAFCNGVGDKRLTLPALEVEFQNATHFIGTHYERLPNGDETYYEVKGELLDRGRVEGELAYLSAPLDPPGAPDRTECSSRPSVEQWTAQRGR